MPKLTRIQGDDYHTQLDVEGNERVKRDGRRRIMLTNLERKELKKRRLAGKALSLMLERSMKIPEIAEELGVSQDLLARYYYHEPELRKEIIKQAVTLFLDIDTLRSRAHIARELGLTVWQLKMLLDTDEFAEIYDDHFAELTNDPTLRVVRTKLIEELLPRSIKVINDILAPGSKASASVRLKASMEVMRLAGITAAAPATSDRRELADFQKKHAEEFKSVQLVQVNIDGEKAEVIEGEVKDVPAD